MIHYDFFELQNGLKVYVHEDTSTPIAAFNICYNVGSRDENEDKTGFAHLFEHLMFGGSANIPSFDEPIQKAGGENNAFTSPDITNYYITLPFQNIETAFWLESDRMLSLSFDPNVLKTQQSVVIEEFKQRYLNQPYGDVWLKLRPLSYLHHPYKWATIGKDISHIENATMEDVKSFFFSHYAPNNAVLVVGGNVSFNQIKSLTEKWFGAIPSRKIPQRNLPQEHPQTQKRELETVSKVPLDAIYKTYHIPGRYQEGFYEVDLLSDILGRGKSARLHQKLVKEEKIFNNISAYTTASLDPGLFVISGNLNKGKSLSEAEKSIENCLEELSNEVILDSELEKVKNQAYSSIAFGEVELLNRVMNIAFAANAGNVEWCNEDKEKIQKISVNDLQQQAKLIFSPDKCNTLFYNSDN
jgi:zinc protease